jgi:hypothetical protein
MHALQQVGRDWMNQTMADDPMSLPSPHGETRVPHAPTR